ncbi:MULTISPECIES: amidase [Halomonadaceae]|jgi:aspartyl-tRNA(Asn)/glutamyl-tRNA(Gln) amidotransferase subunit A|uniref:amidase n=1 Tax=Halomonadaceae TaxID=28256 RepID=UPI0012EF729A|nr:MULTISPECIES: amidase [Halomonas]CAD5258957.1 Amidase [Halomonas sp. 59]CAD5259196.1 Amidase [Halomonas sp. 113]CAD5273133.1 Amidase [Halomonas sp. I3]CAD5289504.1 Amidase [Halomonas sp. 156]VXB32998.1 Amidase [Halomonas titanicae]
MADTFETLTTVDALARFGEGSLSPATLVDDCLARIERDTPKVNAFTCVNGKEARRLAADSARRWQTGTPCGPLDGIPVTIKDLTLTKGLPTRLGSKTTTPDGPWEVDAPISRHLRNAGAIVIGKTTSPEFGWKGVTDNPLHGITRNPWNTELTPGGSSGGAGAAAALNLGLLHQGSDAGGSIRIPCSFTGTFGIKPTFGWVPQWPSSTMSTLSHLGPMTRTAADSALMLSVMAQPDARDGYSGNPLGPDWLTPPPADLRGWRIAFSANLGYVDVATDIAQRVEEAVGHLEALGATVVQVDPGFSDPLKTFNTLWFAGATQALEKLNEQQQAALDPGFLDIARRGQDISLSAYLAARRERSELTAHMATFHQQYDLLVTPTMPIAPFAAGHNVPPSGRCKDWMDWTPFSYPFNLTQQPAASMPCGLDSQGLPVGLHLVAGKYQDLKILHAAQLLERYLPPLTPPVIA